ncbi:transposase [Streptomyces sp. B21-108]
MASTVRKEVNASICAGIHDRMSAPERAGVLRLLEERESDGTTLYNRLKKPAQGPTWSHFKNLAKRLEWVDGLGDTGLWMDGIAAGKITDFAGEADAADVAELRDYQPVKRLALVACLTHKAQMRVRDDLATMFCKRVAMKTKKAKSELEEIRLAEREIVEALIGNYRTVLKSIDEGGPAQEALEKAKAMTAEVRAALEGLDEAAPADEVARRLEGRVSPAVLALARARKPGGIAYHHVSDTYIALFTHFIPCGVWEAVYIIEGLLKNTSEVQPTTVHADTQGQSQPVFALAHLLGFDLMPRIRNWKGMTFYRPSKTTEYVHIDALFGEAGKNAIDFDLIESQFRHLMRVAVSVREGAISSSTLLKRLRSGSKKNATYAAFREVGRVIRTVQLLRYITDAPLRRRVTAATNKVESFNRFSQWIGFGNRGVIADNDPVEQEKAMKFNALLTNAVIFHNALDIAEIVRQLLEEGWEIDPEDLAHISPYLTEHINRFGQYSTHELGIQPDAYDPKLDVDFTPLREQDLTAAGLGKAA